MVNSIAFVDDEIFILESLKWVFMNEPYNILTFQNPLKALQKLILEETAVVVSDLLLPELDGVTFLKEVKQRCSRVECLLMTGDQSCHNLKIDCPVIHKPWKITDLKTFVQDAIDRYEVKKVQER